MPRRNSPLGTIALLLAVLGFGAAAYHYLVEEKVHRRGEAPTPPADEIERLRGLCHEALQSEPSFEGITSFNWRQTSGRYRVDLSVRDGASMAEAKTLARRTSDVVERATDGTSAEVAVLVLGREVWHFVP